MTRSNKKIKYSKNLNKWRKGDSCISNPQNDKYRRLAMEKRISFVKLKNKGLTEAAVHSHNIDINIGEANTLRADDVTSEDFKSNHSCKTFLTNFTTCTVPAFEKFFDKFTKSSSCHTRMLSMHSVVQERVRESNLPETSTSYLCGLMECLGAIKDDEEDVDAALKLISMVIKKTNPAVLQESFGPLSKILYDTYCAYEASKFVLPNLIGCLSVLLRAQPPQQWTYPSVKNMIKKMLDYTISQFPKTRHSAQYNIASILKGSCFMPDYRDEEGENISFVAHPAAEFVGEFICDSLQKSIGVSNAKSTLHLLGFLKLVISSLPLEVLEKICTILLRIIHIGDSLMKKCSMDVILALFKAKKTSLKSEQISCLVRALSISNGEKTKGLMLVPNINDSNLCGLWMSVVTHGVVELVRMDANLGFKLFSPWLDQIVYCWNSDHVSIHDNVVENIDILLSECISPLGGNMKTREIEVQLLTYSVSKGLSLQCQAAWNYVFRAISSVIEIVGASLPAAITECVKKVADFACAEYSIYRKSVEYTIGKAIEVIPIQDMMTILPIKITGNLTEDAKNLWLLPILTKHVRNNSLCFFQDHFSYLAQKCNLLLESLRAKGENSGLLFKQYETVELQLWGLFPSFTKNAVDQEQALNNVGFCKALCNFMKCRDDIRKDILLGLRNMVENCSIENPGKMAEFSKNYIPALFNLYLMKPKALAGEAELGIDNSHRLVALNTVKIYFRICPQTLIDQFFNIVVNKLTSDDEDSFQKRSLIVLLKEFVPYLSSINIKKTCDVIDRYLPKNNKKIKDSELQKGAYRIVEKIWQTENNECSIFVEEKLWEVVEMLKELPRRNALASRINIMRLVLEKLPVTIEKCKKKKILKFFIESGVEYCQRENCKRPRVAAYRLLLAIGPAMEKLLKLSTKDMVVKFLSLLPRSESDSLIGSKIDIIMMTMMKYKDLIDCNLMNNIMEEILQNLIRKSTIASAASLTFILQVYRAWPTSFMSDFVEPTIIQLSKMDKRYREFKHRNLFRRVICRLLRKFGANRVKAAVPNNDDTMKKVLKNLMTLEAQKSKERVRKDDSMDEEEYEDDVMPSSGIDEILKELDSDDENGQNKMPKKILKKKLYIKEGDENEVIDLLNPSSVFTKARKVRFATDCKTSTKKPEDGFKTDQTSGKFIIEENISEGKADEGVNYMDLIDQDSLFTDKSKKEMSQDDDEEQDLLPNVQKKRKLRPKAVKYIGHEFKAKRAGGDVKKKGGIQPYAYVKLNRKMINKRFQSKLKGQFKYLSHKGIRQAPRKKST